MTKEEKLLLWKKVTNKTSSNKHKAFLYLSFSAKSWQNPARIDIQWVATIECQCWQDLVGNDKL